MDAGVKLSSPSPADIDRVPLLTQGKVHRDVGEMAITSTPTEIPSGALHEDEIAIFKSIWGHPTKSQKMYVKRSKAFSKQRS